MLSDLIESFLVVSLNQYIDKCQKGVK